MMADSSWSASTLRNSSFQKVLTTDELRFPDNLSQETLQSHLRDRNIIQEETLLDKNTLVFLFRKHISPLPQRTEKVNRVQNHLKGVSIHDSAR